MNFTQSSLQIRQKLAHATNTSPDDWFLCLKARYGMAIVCESIYQSLGKGEVITTPYTCTTAINPILVSHLTPIYADLNLNTLSIKDPSKLITSKTRAIVAQHTLGIINGTQVLFNLAKKHRLLLIEDSSHCLARLATDPNGQILADISIHSFGVEKVLKTKFGGAIYLNPRLKDNYPTLNAKLRQKLSNLKSPGPATAMRIRLYRAENAILQRLPQNLKKPLRHSLTSAKLFEPAILPMEQNGKQPQPLASNSYVNQKILQLLPTLPQNYHNRIRLTNFYLKSLSNTPHIKFINDLQDQPLLAFPIFLDSPQRANMLYSALTSSGFFIRRWYSPLFFPGIKSKRSYKYHPEDCPIAERIHPLVLCLPTDITTAQARQILSILNPKAKTPLESSSNNRTTPSPKSKN